MPDARKIEKCFGITHTQAYALGYRSAPCSEVFQTVIEYEIATRFECSQIASAGFYIDERLRINIASGGILVPGARDGVIKLIAVFKDVNKDTAKWFYFTSKEFPRGIAACPSIHIANSNAAKRERVAVLTTNIIEADALALKGNICAIATNSIKPSKIARQLRESLPSVRVIVIPSRLVNHSLRHHLNQQNFNVIEEQENEFITA